MRQMQKKTMQELKRQAVIKNMKSMGIHHIGQESLHNLEYAELKWAFALELAKKETDL